MRYVPQEREDLVQDGLVKVIAIVGKSTPTVECIKLGTKILSCLVIDRLRKKRRERLIEYDELAQRLESSTNEKSYNEGLLDMLSVASKDEELKKAMGQAGINVRYAIASGHDSNDKIARALGITRESVRQARRRMQDRLGEIVSSKTAQ